MARPEAEIDGSTPEGEFALGLRALRDKARLDYRAMEKLVHFAASTLSKAASGNGLPTLEVTRAYVRACGGDEQEWEAKWHDLRNTLGRASRTGSAVPSQRGTEAADEQEPDLSRIPEQVKGDQVSSGDDPDLEATDRIPRLTISATTRSVPAGPRHRAAQPLQRRGSTWVIVALILVNISLLAALALSAEEPASGSQIPTVASSIQSFEIAEIDEPLLVLRAGAQEVRWVDLRNPNATDLVVTELLARVKAIEDDSFAGAGSCPAEVLNISNMQGFPYRIDGRGITRVGFKFEVAKALPEGCGGRAVRIEYTGKAIQGTVIEGRLKIS